MRSLPVSPYLSGMSCNTILVSIRSTYQLISSIMYSSHPSLPLFSYFPVCPLFLSFLLSCLPSRPLPCHADRAVDASYTVLAGTLQFPNSKPENFATLHNFSESRRGREEKRKKEGERGRGWSRGEECIHFP